MSIPICTALVHSHLVVPTADACSASSSPRNLKVFTSCPYCQEFSLASLPIPGLGSCAPTFSPPCLYRKLRLGARSFSLLPPKTAVFCGFQDQGGGVLGPFLIGFPCPYPPYTRCRYRIWTVPNIIRAGFIDICSPAQGPRGMGARYWEPASTTAGMPVRGRDDQPLDADAAVLWVDDLKIYWHALLFFRQSSCPSTVFQ